MRKYLVGASTAAVLALAGCGGDHATPSGMDHGGGTTHSNPTSTSAPAAQTAHNDEDIAFAQGMIPHHAQAVEMARLAPSRSGNQKVIDLATRIQQAQDPEIKQLTDMLTRWGSAPAGTPDTGHGGHGGGMMTAAEMKQLEAATGAEFDRMWTQMMIKHHEGAVDMARTELAKGTSTEAKALAQKIIDAQQAEITEMRGLVK